MNKRLKFTQKSTLFLLFVMLLYIIVTSNTSVNFSTKLIMLGMFLFIFLKGVETYLEGQKRRSIIPFGIFFILGILVVGSIN
ncbi:hypothetical protein [Halobacillus sp. A5]|uniref:hypothetical protein n=1 Tax=Halobacillus sp. A5 TaxID=2880263 RepID=UPI0020A6A0CB|nr:hypothetical protein [Halobacillus sp. A5]MCP3027110.1 hypothetical protein [Halobacillus sp. A5]